MVTRQTDAAMTPFHIGSDNTDRVTALKEILDRL
jgi:hypothetical protein